MFVPRATSAGSRTGPDAQLQAMPWAAPRLGPPIPVWRTGAKRRSVCTHRVTAHPGSLNSFTNKPADATSLRKRRGTEKMTFLRSRVAKSR
ncbi:hypothetical protein EVAR_20764_1 [Eumeta japonica]|uniref:Uncharacterized protein n=1 Tax=Eumeta variegata TaxID=151549 RepID=A0A4C1V985_EUMVA|nr:hypothetical protein EVAR_20764_1 [Eumeta japonica]